MNTEQKMQKAIENLESRLVTIRAGRANPAMLSKVMVSYYGTPTPIQSVANITVPDAKQLMIKPFDRSSLKDIEKAINEANLGIAPVNNGEVIILPMPELTEDRRREYVKQAKALCEDAKVALRNVRRDGMDDAKASQKAGEITEDDLNDAEEKIQKITNKYTEIVDSTISSKEKEIMEV